MATKLARDFQRLRVLTSLDLRQRMDALVQDLSHALEMEDGAASASSQLRIRKRIWKRRSKSTGNLASSSIRTALTAHHSDDSNSSLGELVFGSQDKGTFSSMHQSDSDDLGATTKSRPFHPFSLHSLHNISCSIAESDSFNENFTPTKSSARRKRKFKRMAIDVDPNVPSTSQQALAMPRDLRQKNLFKHDVENRFSSFVCGKRKRSLRERSIEFDQGLNMASLHLLDDAQMECSDLDTSNNEMISSSSLSSSESDAGIFTNDEGREGDDEQSDWFFEPGPVFGIAEMKVDWEASDETSQEAEADQASGRDIRSGRRQLHERRPGFRIRTSANEKLSRFLRDPVQSELRLHPMQEQERDQLNHLAKLYSLSIRSEAHCGVIYPVLTKTRNTQRARPIVMPNARAQSAGDFKRRRPTPPTQPQNVTESVDESDSLPPIDFIKPRVSIEKTSDESL